MSLRALTAAAATLVITDHYRVIGARGGSASSPAKTQAARAAARKRWGHPEPAARVIPPSRLKDGAWYSGTGRNGGIAVWDRKQQCFWITSISDLPDPLVHPQGGSRVVRLKQEGHVAHSGGTFAPVSLIRKG